MIWDEFRWAWFSELLWVDNKSTRWQIQLSKFILSLCCITFANVSLGEANHIAKLIISEEGKYILSPMGGSVKGHGYSER